MVKYDAKTLEREFKAAASLRISRKNRGNQDYANDAGYWTGGRCNWGGSHNLSKDCQTIARGFSKLEDLKTVEKELQQCTSEQEFNSTKSRLVRQAEEVERGLQTRTGPASSMFGVCIIWRDYENFIESKLRPLRSELSTLKQNIDSQQYKFYEELKLLKLEQKQIENRMKENKRKAQSEKDPAKKAFLLQLIEEDGKRLEENLKKQRDIPTSNLRFEPDKYVSDLIDSLKSAIREDVGGGGKGSGTSGRNRNKKDDDSDSDDDNDNGPSVNTPGSSSKKRNNENKNQNQPNQQQLLILAGLALLIIFYFYSQPAKKEPHYYDF